MDAIDLGCPSSLSDPAAYFSRWRERGDVSWSPEHNGWVLIGYEAVSDAFRDGERLSADRVSVFERVAASRREAFGQVVEVLRSWMIFRDPPAHTRLRTPVRSTFTTRRVHDLEPLIDEIVAEAIDEMLADADNGVARLTEHVARPVPALVIGALLGVSPADRPRLQEWSDHLATIVFSLDPGASTDDRAISAADSFVDFFGRLVDAARSAPDQSLIGQIARLDTSFDLNELISMCTLLLFAGHETTTSLLNNAFAVMLERPALADELRRNVDGIPTAVEEFLRVFGPRTMVRKASQNHERGGQMLTRGDTVYLSIAAANHDERVFDEPGRFDLRRDPNPHLGFGWGAHHCLGAHLARAEARIVLTQVLARVPDLRPAGPVPPLDGYTMGFVRGDLSVEVP